MAETVEGHLTKLPTLSFQESVTVKSSGIKQVSTTDQSRSPSRLAGSEEQINNGEATCDRWRGQPESGQVLTVATVEVISRRWGRRSEVASI